MFGFQAGVTIGAGTITPTASLNLGKGSGSSSEVTNIEATLSAGGTATVVTPGALTLKGATLEADAVKIGAGSLAIESLQDSKVFASKQTNVGVGVSLQGGGQGGTGSVSFDQSKEKGAFASVAEQSGIMAGAGGFDIRVAGETDLKGAVIASNADAAKNTLATGTLSASNITNTETYKASQIGISAGIAGIGADKNATPPPQNTGNDGQPDASVGSGGTKIPGIKTGIGTLSAGAPGFLSASGSQSGTTNSAIAPATIIIATGPGGAQDAASQAIANTISRDTATANDGALTQEFDAAKRAEVQAGFEAAKALTQQTAVFFANRAAEEKAAKDEAKALEQKLAAAGAVRTDANGNALRDDRGNLVTIGTLSPEVAAAVTLADTRNADAKSLNDTFGAGSPARILATAFSGAAGSNVAGSLGGLAQSAVVNVLQSLAVTQVKQIADSLGSDANKDGILDKPTVTTETVRAALQAVTGCAGAAAGGSGNCGSAAIGASASVVANYLLTSFVDPKTIDPLTGKEIPRTLEDQQARSDLVATFIGAITAAAGLDASSAATAAQIETQNNANAKGERTKLVGVNYGIAEIAESNPDSDLARALNLARQGNESDQVIADRHRAYVDCLAAPAATCIVSKADLAEGGRFYGMAALASAFNAVTPAEVAKAAGKSEADYQFDVAYLRGLGIEVGSNNGGTPMTRDEVRALAAERRNDIVMVTAAMDQNRRAALEIESRYDAIYGTGAYKQKLAFEIRQAEILQDDIRAAQRRAELEILCASLVCPALAAVGGIILLEAGVVTVAVTTARPLLTYSTTTATGGGLFNASLGAGFDAATGEKITIGSVGGDFIAGAAFNQSYLTWGQRINNPYVRGTVSGFVSGISGETTTQLIEGNGLNGGEILQQGAFNGIGGTVGAAFNRSLNNSYAPVWQGLLTREINYGINIQTNTAVRAGVNETVRIILPTTAVEGTVSQGAESSLDALRNWQIPSSPNPPRVQSPPAPLPTPKPQCDPAKEKC